MNVTENIKKALMQNKNVNIVFIGDSITSTEWVHPNWREIVEYALKEELNTLIKKELPNKQDAWKIPSWGIRCFNCGFDGSTTQDILSMMDDRILIHKPDVVIWLLNTNDRHFKVPAKTFENNINKILKELSDKCQYILFANAIPGNRKEYNEYSKDAYANLAKNIQLPEKTLFIHSFKEFSRFDLDKLFTFKSTGNPFLDLKSGDTDYVHPNSLGNAYIAKIILEKGFDIKFDPEKYIKESKKGEMYPGY